MNRTWSAPLAVGLALAGMSGLTARTALAAGGMFMPSLGVGSWIEEYRSPIEAPNRSTRAVLIPELVYIARDEGSSVHATLRRHMTFDPREPFSTNPLSRQQTTDYGFLRAHRTWSDIHGASIRAGTRRSYDLIDDARRLVPVEGNYTGWDLLGRGSRWRMEGSYRAEGWVYSSANRPDAIRLIWDAAFLPIHRRDTALLLGWRQLQLQLASTTAVRSRMGFVGYRRALTPLIAGQIEVGASDVMFADGSRWQGPGVTLGVRGPRFDEGVASATVMFQPGLPIGSTARLSRPLPGALLTMFWESMVTSEAGVGNEPNFQRQFIGEVSDTLSQATVIGGTLGYGWTRPLRAAGPSGQVMRGSGWIERRLRPWMSARGGLSYLSYRTNEPDRPSPVRRFRLDAMMIVHR